MILSRVFPPVAGRLNANETLVYNIAELRSVIAAAAVKSQALAIRLGGDILMSTGITVPATIPSFTLSGNGTHGFKYIAAVDKVITIASDLTYVQLFDLSFESAAASVATTLVSCTVGLTTTRLRMAGLDVRNTTNLLDPARNWSQVAVSDCALTGVAITDSGGGFISSGMFSHLTGTMSVAFTTSGGNTFTGCRGGSFDTATANNLNTAISCAFTSYTIGASDVILPGATISGIVAQLTALAFTSNDRTLNSANPSLSIGNYSFVRVDIQAGATGNITLTDGVRNGQLLTIFVTSYAGTATIPDSTASNVRLAGTFTPVVRATLQLFWDSSDGNWIETSRSLNG